MTTCKLGCNYGIGATFTYTGHMLTSLNLVWF